MTLHTGASDVNSCNSLDGNVRLPRALSVMTTGHGSQRGQSRGSRLPARLTNDLGARGLAIQHVRSITRRRNQDMCMLRGAIEGYRVHLSPPKLLKMPHVGTDIVKGGQLEKD